MAYQLFNKGVQNETAWSSFIDATLGVCEGQQYDIDFETRNNVTEAEYMEMIRLKTSLLLACALKIGAQLADASDSDADLLYQFGEKMGLAFQLQDDLLDVYGDPAVFGKKIGGDILCNKKTYMLINALQMANEQQRVELNQWIEQKEFDANEKIQAVRAIYDAVGIRQVCEAKIEELFAESLRALDLVDVESEKKQGLRDFAHQLMHRKY
jgi:geranylgeranyl diphosphate synthase type II